MLDELIPIPWNYIGHRKTGLYERLMRATLDHVCYSRQNFLLFYNNNSSLCSSLLCYNNSFLLYLTFMLQQFILVVSHYYVTTMHSGQILIEYATTATIRIADWNPHILIWWIRHFINNDKRNTIPAQSSKSMDKFSHGHDLNT